MSLRHLLPLITIALLATACDKELDSPPERTIPVGGVLNIAQLKALYSGQAVHFDSSLSVYAVVNCDENDGNFYKSIYAQDSTGGICLRLLSSGGLYTGDSIRIYLPGTVLAPYNGLMQLDSVNVDNNVVKQATLVPVEPLVTTIDQLDPVAMQGMLVQLDSVEFVSSEAISSTWATPDGGSATNRTLEDCDGNQVLVRTSDYANYAGLYLPQGKGTFIGILSVYGSDLQLYARTLGEQTLNGERCPGQELPFFVKNFEDLNISSGGWTQQNVSGSINWTADSFGADNFGRCTNYVANDNLVCETWLISPAVNITSLVAPTLSFRTACMYTGPELQVLVSTDYVSGLPSTATWTPVTVTLSPGSWTWTPSGNINLLPYSSTNFHVAFKYTGGDNDGKNYELDDIKIFEP